MKNIHTKFLTGTLILSLFLSMGCSDILNEEPRGIYEPGFFQTEKGVLGGLTALYEHLRYMYGNGYYLNAYQTGTDEVTYGHGADSNYKDADLSGVGSLTASTSRSDVLWNQAFTNINTASGIIENATEVGISEALIAEARFFRAFDYFLLVQTFGGVPLDLGAGELAFNTSTSRTSVRNTVPEVYTKAIFPDLLTAINDLPETGRVTGGATKTLARLFLAKAYLTYGWWLENPKNIPTYPKTSRTDPDGHDAQWYFQQAYNVAITAIENPGPFSLQDTYYDVNLAQNDRNSEMLLYADHTELSEYYDGSSNSYNSGSSPGNFAVWMMTWDYTFLRSAATAGGAYTLESVQREAVQAYGRPWKCMCPTIDVITGTFADKTYDSRFDGTFVSTFRGNWEKAGLDYEYVYNANSLTVPQGGVILSFIDTDQVISYPQDTDSDISNVGAGILPGRAEYVIGNHEFSRYAYPNLWKLGMYRTDNGGGLGMPNGGIARPFPVAKFSELYLVAAEAAVKGATGNYTARQLVNVLRARAGKWRWDNNGNQAKTDDFSTRLTDETPAVITIDYILDERTREFFGEGYRWYDLVRTQTWRDRSSTYTIAGNPNSLSDPLDHTVRTYTRTIEDYHYLRPIPQGQLDGMEMTADEKSAYQNPGYR